MLEDGHGGAGGAGEGRERAGREHARLRAPAGKAQNHVQPSTARVVMAFLKSVGTRTSGHLYLYIKTARVGSGSVSSGPT